MTEARNLFKLLVRNDLPKRRVHGSNFQHVFPNSKNPTGSFTQTLKVAVIATCGITLLPFAAQADIIAEDDFSYPNGNLTGRNGGSGGWGGDYTDSGNSLAVASDEVNESGGPGTVGINFRALSTTITTSNYPGEEIWMGFDGNLVLAGGFGFGGISFFDGGAEKGLIGGILGRDMFGFSGSDTGVTGWNRVVVQFKLNTNAISLWTGPAGGQVDTSVAAAQTGSYDIKGSDNLRFALNSTNAGGSIRLDNFILATTSAEVATVASPPSDTDEMPEFPRPDLCIMLSGFLGSP